MVFSGPNQQQGKKIHLDKGGNINIFIAIDASDSIDKDHIQKSIDITKNLIEKVCWSGHLFSSTYTEHESRTYILAQHETIWKISVSYSSCQEIC